PPIWRSPTPSAPAAALADPPDRGPAAGAEGVGDRRRGRPPHVPTGASRSREDDVGGASPVDPAAAVGRGGGGGDVAALAARPLHRKLGGADPPRAVRGAAPFDDVAGTGRRGPRACGPGFAGP